MFSLIPSAHMSFTPSHIHHIILFHPFSLTSTFCQHTPSKSTEQALIWFMAKQGRQWSKFNLSGPRGRVAAPPPGRLPWHLLYINPLSLGPHSSQAHQKTIAASSFWFRDQNFSIGQEEVSTEWESKKRVRVILFLWDKRKESSAAIT
jgi:hypothetical protein